MKTMFTLAAIVASFSFTHIAQALTIPVTEDVMTSSFFQGVNQVRGYGSESNRPVLRVSTHNPSGTTGAETLYLSFDYDFSTLAGPLSFVATLTMRSVAGGFGMDASDATPFTVSAHGVNANPFTRITDDTNPSGPSHWLDFYNNNILPANSAARTAVNCIDCAVRFDVSALVNSWIAGTNSHRFIALTGRNDTSGSTFLHGFVNNNNGGVLQGATYLTVASVPEAETWAMLLAGLGLTGWMVRRRKRQDWQD